MAFTAFTLWVALAVSVEYTIEILKQVFPALNTKVNGVDNERLLALFLGVVVCVGARVDFFAMLGIDYGLPYVGYLISAIFIAGGSGKLHDFIKAIVTLGESSRLKRVL